MVHYYLQCKVCKKEFAGDSGYYKCPDCAGKLEVRYVEWPRIKRLSDLVDYSRPGIWKFWRLLPIKNVNSAISLGEGNTFLHRCKRIARRYGFRELWIKNEGINPTGSFKDRNAAVSVTNAMQLGAQSVAIASDANAGPAVAAYAAVAGLRCYAFMPTSTVLTRLVQTQFLGAYVIRIKGNSLVNDCIDLVEKLQPTFNWHNLTTAGPVNPYQLEAPKTIAYEIAIDLHGAMPEWVAAPCGGGGLLVALFKAFEELLAMNVVDRMPRLLCVQSLGCAPVVEAFNQKREKIVRWNNPQPTIAVPIAVPLPLDGEEVLQALKSTEGFAVAVDDAEIVELQRLLAQEEGIFASPTGVVAIVGVIKAREYGVIRDRESVVAIITETGLKDLGQISLQYSIPTFAADDLPSIKEYILSGALMREKRTVVDEKSTMEDVPDSRPHIKISRQENSWSEGGEKL